VSEGVYGGWRLHSYSPLQISIWEGLKKHRFGRKIRGWMSGAENQTGGEERGRRLSNNFFRKKRRREKAIQRWGSRKDKRNGSVRVVHGRRELSGTPNG